MSISILVKNLVGTKVGSAVIAEVDNDMVTDIGVVVLTERLVRLKNLTRLLGVLAALTILEGSYDLRIARRC